MSQVPRQTSIWLDKVVLIVELVVNQLDMLGKNDNNNKSICRVGGWNFPSYGRRKEGASWTSARGQAGPDWNELLSGSPGKTQFSPIFQAMGGARKEPAGLLLKNGKNFKSLFCSHKFKCLT